MWIRGKVSASHAAAPVSITGKVGMINFPLSLELDGWWSNTSVASVNSKYTWIKSQIVPQRIRCESMSICTSDGDVKPGGLIADFR